MNRAIITLSGWIWPIVAALALALMAAMDPVQTHRFGVGNVIQAALSLLVVLATQNIGLALGWRFGWALGLTLSITFAALPALSLRPEAQAHAATFKAGDTPWPAIRPTGHVALLACQADCMTETRALLRAGAYSVFIASGTDAGSELDATALPDASLPGISYSACGPSCQHATQRNLGFNDLAYYSVDIATPQDPYVIGVTRRVLLRQSEGEWTQIARDTSVRFRVPGLWPGILTLAGGLDGLHMSAEAFDLSARP